MAADIPGVAKYQKLLIWLVLLHIVILAANFFVRSRIGPPESPDTAMVALSMVIGLVSLAIAIASVVVIVLLMTAMDRPLISKILAAIAMFIPLVGLIVLLVVNAKATGMLRSAGYKVGLMGASRPAG